MMKPKIVMHTQLSLDGRIRGFERPDLYYLAAGRYSPDAVLFGSTTVAAALENAPEDPPTSDKPTTISGDQRPLGVIADSQGICRKLGSIRGMGYLRDVIVLVSDTTPPDYIAYLDRGGYEHIRAGNDHVDFIPALEELNKRFGVNEIRTDSGGTLTSILLGLGLVDEISLVVSPCLVGALEPYAFQKLEISSNINLEFTGCEQVEENYLVITYIVKK